MTSWAKCSITGNLCGCALSCKINPGAKPEYVVAVPPVGLHIVGLDGVIREEEIGQFKETYRDNKTVAGTVTFAPNTKVSTGKPRVDLLPPSVLLEVARVMDYGASVHGENNWQNGIPWMKYYAAAMRHLLKFAAGENMDTGEGGTGESHLACSIADLMILLYYFQNREHYRQFDNRFFNKENKNVDN